MKKLKAKDFLTEAENIPIIDVRSPGEFAEGHIPGANNIPLFTNEERAEIGTIYKQVGKQEAILRGLEIVGSKMAKFSAEALQLQKDNHLLVHCWRGGMRSESMAWLFERIGIKCSLLEGGYKAYRNFIFDEFVDEKRLVILKGLTGSGKTEMLESLKKLGEQTIDLEGLANHKGSSFGGVGMGAQPSTQQFHNDLYLQLSQQKKDEPIWVEGESKAIGKVFMPLPFWESMCESRIIEVDVPLAHRVNRLVRDYSKLDKEEMENAIKRLEKRLGNLRMNEILKLYQEGEFAKVSVLLLEYYDKTYKHSISRDNKKHEQISFTSEDMEFNMKELIKYKFEAVPELETKEN